MPDVNVSADDLRKLSSALRQYETRVKEASRALEGSLRSLPWNDPQKVKFESRLREFHRQVERFMASEVDAMSKAANDMARKVDDLRNTRM